ncbi:MAG: NAD/NADP octopine/nopaline dehydrogenase family protein [Acidovorax temperans]|uniref:NAD/NADP octopine/nopaline dehydrogenase family protein n=1 Tax=Acidovorax temperans TaxID=80878 RepID=UPI00391BC59F
MRVSIVGAGAIAFGMAALLEAAGHEAMLWSPSGQRTQELGGGRTLTATGAISGSFAPHVAPSCAQAMAWAQVVVFALPATGHRFAFDTCVPHVRPGLPLIISSHLSFGALYLNRQLSSRGISAPIIALASTVCTARQRSSNAVHVGTIRSRVDMATLPARSGEAGHQLCTELFGDRFTRRDGLLTVSLGNVNPQNHLAIALLNLTRMEHAQAWNQAENVTPAVGRLIESLDAERLAIAGALGVQVKAVQEHIAQSYQLPQASVAQMNQERYRQGLGVMGPTTADSRYVLEDVPFGLVPTVRLGRAAGVETRLHEAGVALLCAAYGRDFTKENDLLVGLDLEQLGVEALRRLARDGYC